MYADEEEARDLAGVDEPESDELADEADPEDEFLEEVELARPPMAAGVALEGVPIDVYAGANGQAVHANPLDPLGLGKATMDVWKAMLANPQGLMAGQM